MPDLGSLAILYTKPQASTPLSVAYAASITLDLSQRSNFVIGALTGNLTLAFSNPIPGMGGCVELRQDATGGRTITLSGTNFSRNGGTTIVLSTSANAYDILTYYVDSTSKICVNLGMKGVA